MGMEEAELPLHCKDFSEHDSALRRGREYADHHVASPASGWDWRTRKWIDNKHLDHTHPQPRPHSHPHHPHRHHRHQENFADESIDGRISRLRRDAGRMVSQGRLAARRSSRHAGWVSELETISERKRRGGYGGEALTRIRRDKSGPRSRRRANHHIMDLHSRRKLMRREHQLRRDISACQNKGEGETVNALQLLGETKHASKSFSMQTLEEYLIERTAARKLQSEGNQEGLSIVSMQPKYLEKPCRSTRRNAVVRSMKDISAEPALQLPLSIYASEDGPEEDSEAQRSGCGLSWRWLNAHNPKDDSSMPLHTDAGCFPAVSKRRIGRRLLVSRQRKAGCVGWDKYNSEGSFTSFDSDSETVPLMTEPEPFHDYTTDDFAGSPVEFESGFSKESKSMKGSRFKESGMSSNGQRFRRTDYESECKEVGVHERQSAGRHRSLSQKHRPKTFKDLVGQPMVAQSLSNAVLRGKIAPVYLFQGPRGTGKTCAARIFTAALNCLSSEELRPCGTCKECLSLHAGKNFDVREVDAAGNTGIESMKLLLKHMSLPPSSRYKVFIIDECHVLTMDAWNVFLKSLEEPPSYVVFILITTDLDQLPRTALSRCQKFLFSKIKDADLVSRLEKIALWERIDVELAALQLIASRSDGSLMEAETTLDQISLLGKRATLSVVQELVGMISEKKLIEFLELALSPDTSSTVKSIRDFMESGVEPLALISQLATLITDIIAGNNRSAAYRFKHVRKVEDERFRQALRILSDAERQLRSCTDRTTWLTAAFLQFSQIDPSNAPPYSLGTSVTQSPVNFFDTSEKETVEGDAKWDSHSPQHAERMDRGDQKRLDSQSNPFSSPLIGNKVHPCNQSPKSAADVDDARTITMAGASKPPVVPRASTSGVNRAEQKQASTMSTCSMDSIWKKVLDSSRSNVTKQLLRGEAKLLSLSVTEALAVAHLEFKHPEHKNVAERARSSIANAFQESLGCPVEVKITLSSSSEDNNLGWDVGTPSLTGNLEQPSKQKKMVTLSKGNNKAYRSEERSSLQDPRGRRSGSFRKLSSTAKIGIPVASSPRIRLPEPRKPRHSLEAEGSPYSQSYSTEFSERERSNTSNGKLREGGDRMLKPTSHVSENDALENGRVSVHYDGKASRSSNAFSSHQFDDANRGHGLDSYSRGNMDKDSDAEHGFSPSPMDGNTFHTDVDKDGSDSETEDSYGPSLLCWKGSRVNVGKGKHQRLRRKRRGRLLLKFVPCAKGEGRS